MNIEDKTIGGELVQHIDFVKYIHLADSNRLAAGQGHTDFSALFSELLQTGYDGWLSVEILPQPSPDVAARQAAEFLLPLIHQRLQRATCIRNDLLDCPFRLIPKSSWKNKPLSLAMTTAATR